MSESAADTGIALLPADAMPINRFLGSLREPIRMALCDRVFSVFGDVERCSSSWGSLYLTLIDRAERYSYMLRVFVPSSVMGKSCVEVRVGSKLLVTGTVSTTKIGNELQLNASSFIDIGIGSLVAQVERWKKEYAALFGRRKKPLPELCLRVGVISNEETQGFVDFSRHLIFGEVVLRKTKMQGNSVAEDVASAILEMDGEDYDCICIIRGGGGAFTDLFEFNRPVLLEAIGKSQVPVVTAIGHESDVLLADLCADLSVGTPTALGKLLSARFEEKMRDCAAMKRSIGDLFLGILDARIYSVAESKKVLVSDFGRGMDERMSEVRRLSAEVRSLFVTGVDVQTDRVRHLKMSLKEGFISSVEILIERVRSLKKEVEQEHEASLSMARSSNRFKMLLVVCGLLGVCLLIAVVIFLVKR